MLKEILFLKLKDTALFILVSSIGNRLLFGPWHILFIWGQSREKVDLSSQL